jgi:hypothetical protein
VEGFRKKKRLVAATLLPVSPVAHAHVAVLRCILLSVRSDSCFLAIIVVGQLLPVQDLASLTAFLVARDFEEYPARTRSLIRNDRILLPESSVLRHSHSHHWELGKTSYYAS